MVTSPHSLASAAGLDVLRAGGSAIDAAIATSAVLSVVYPHMTGLGGDAFWLIHNGASGEIRTLNGGGKAAESATLSALEARGLNEIPMQGIVPATLTVPGGVASWTEAHDAYGRLPLRRVLESAIGYARDGFPVTGRLASFIEMTRDDLVRDQEAAALFFPDGAAAQPATKLANANLARTLQSIADNGVVRLLSRAGRRRDVALFGSGGRAVSACRFRPAKGHLGRAPCRPLPRRHGLQHAAADAGFCRARNAQPRRAARTAPQGFPRARPCPSPGTGQADRLSRPRSGARRPLVCRCHGRAADIEAIRRRARPADRRKVGIGVGHGASF